MLKSLSGFPQQLKGQKIVIEFKDESAAEGFIESCDDSMNITLSEVKYFKRRIRTGPPSLLEAFFARGCFIRFVHFQFPNPDIIKSYISRVEKVEEKPRTRRVFGSQTRLPNVFGHIKIHKLNADLDEYLKTYEVITPRFRSLNSSISPYNYHFSFNAFDKSFVLILRQSDMIPGAHSNFRLLDAFGKDRSHELLSSITYYEGYLSGAPHTSATLTIGKGDDDYMGRIDAENETYFIEPAPNSNNTIFYRTSDVKIDLSKFGPRGHSLLVPECLRKTHLFDNFTRNKRAVNRKPAKKNRCEMKLVADFEFYKVIGNNNYYSAARYLINVIERVNRIFTAVNWGINGHGEQLINLGFLIKEITILDHPTPKTNHFHFNNEYSQSGSNYFDVTNLMTSFSEEEGSNSSCVTVLITAKILENGILGLATIGNTAASIGACYNEPTNDYYVNTAVVTVMKKEGLMITRIFDLVIAHELGHLWGSTHDSEECTKESQNGRFIMHDSANTGYDKNNYRFSKCTIDQIFKVLYTVQPKCFIEEQRSLCGNGILEPSEECDAGGKFGKSGPLEDGHEDPCCTSECKLRPNALCSPKHAECCSPTCGYLPADRMCQPRNNDTCRAEAFCTGNSSFCPLQENVQDGTSCSDEGTCRHGTCIPFCETFSNDSRPCICENLRDSCYRCCKQGEYGKCSPVIPYKYLKEGSICILGHCRNHVCEKEVTDVATHFWRLIKDINQTSGSKLFGDYLVFVVIFVMTIIWIPCACLVRSRDKRNEENKERAQEDSVEIISTPKKIKSQTNVSTA